MKINIKDIISSAEIGDGFIIIHNDMGYFLGVCGKEGFEEVQMIDRETYKSLELREGNRI